VEVSAMGDQATSAQVMAAVEKGCQAIPECAAAAGTIKQAVTTFSAILIPQWLPS
jgi:hypothetical protein